MIAEILQGDTVKPLPIRKWWRMLKEEAHRYRPPHCRQVPHGGLNILPSTSAQGYDSGPPLLLVPLAPPASGRFWRRSSLVLYHPVNK